MTLPRAVPDYSEVFGHLKGRFVTLSPVRPKKMPAREAVAQVIALLEDEADQNLVYDHYQPEIAGPLQQAIYFLALVMGEAQP